MHSGPKSSFQMRGSFVFHLETKVIVWRKGGEAHSPSCLKSSVKFPQSVMIWGAMSSACVGPFRKLLSMSLGPKRAWRVMNGSTHPPSRQQAAVGWSLVKGSTHAPSAKLWNQVSVHRTLRPLLGLPRARSLRSTSLPYRGYVGGPACTVSGCRGAAQPSRWRGPSDSAM